MAAGSTCSKLSSTTNSRRPDSASSTRSSAGRPPTSSSPSARAIAPGTRSGWRTGVRSTSTTPSGKWSPCSLPAEASARRAAAFRARRVLPTPAGPVSVSRRVPPATSDRTIVSSSCTRPTSGVGPASDQQGWRRGSRTAPSLRPVLQVSAVPPVPDSTPATVGVCPVATTPSAPPAVLRAAATSSSRCCPSSVSAAARSSTVANRGVRRLPDSSAEMALGLRPARAASCSCVRPAAARKRSSNAPNGARSSLAVFTVFAVFSIAGPCPTPRRVAVSADRAARPGYEHACSVHHPHACQRPPAGILPPGRRARGRAEPRRRSSSRPSADHATSVLAVGRTLSARRLRTLSAVSQCCVSDVGVCPWCRRRACGRLATARANAVAWMARSEPSRSDAEMVSIARSR